jgi:hypothetical protein
VGQGSEGWGGGGWEGGREEKGQQHVFFEGCWVGTRRGREGAVCVCVCVCVCGRGGVGNPQGSDTLATLVEGLRFVLCASPATLQVCALLFLRGGH